MSQPKAPPQEPGVGAALATAKRELDRDLILRLRSKDEAAFACLVRSLHGELLRLARMFVPSEALAEEVVQETWLAVINGLDGFLGRSSLKTWIIRILVNRAKTRGVRERRFAPISTVEEQGAGLDERLFDAGGQWLMPLPRFDDKLPERAALNVELRGVLEAALLELPKAQQQVVTLRDVEGLAAAEVCQLLEISQANQRVLLHRARSKLRAVVASYLEGQR